MTPISEQRPARRAPLLRLVVAENTAAALALVADVRGCDAPESLRRDGVALGVDMHPAAPFKVPEHQRSTWTAMTATVDGTYFSDEPLTIVNPDAATLRHLLKMTASAEIGPGSLCVLLEAHAIEPIEASVQQLGLSAAADYVHLADALAWGLVTTAPVA